MRRKSSVESDAGRAAPVGTGLGDPHTTVPTSAPMPIVTPIAKAPQNATRITAGTWGAPPRRATVAISAGYTMGPVVAPGFVASQVVFNYITNTAYANFSNFN